MGIKFGLIYICWCWECLINSIDNTFSTGDERNFPAPKFGDSLHSHTLCMFLRWWISDFDFEILYICTSFLLFHVVIFKILFERMLGGIDWIKSCFTNLELEWGTLRRINYVRILNLIYVIVQIKTTDIIIENDVIIRILEFFL